MMIAQQFIKEGHPVKLVLEVLEIPRSSYYYRPKPGTGCKGREQSTHTIQGDGSIVRNEVVVKDIEWILGQEFVDYGYLKVTHWLRQERDYIINPKKVYRLMSENGLLNKFNEQATDFMNLGKDARLVVPTKKTDKEIYNHMGKFIRLAEQEQIIEVFKRVGKSVLEEIESEKLIWLNTAGLGVIWLHIRMDTRPKHYKTSRYKEPSFLNNEVV